MAKVGRTVKESMVAEVETQLAERPNFFVTMLNRLPASETDTFRRKLYQSQARLIVVKRRLGRLALAQIKISGAADLLEGSVGLVLVGDDPLSTVKLLVDFRKAHEEQLAIRGGIIDGQLLDGKRIEQFATLPSKPVLLAQVIGMVESPIAGVIMTVERLIGDIIRGIDQLATKRGTETSSTASQNATPAPPGG